MNLGCAVEQAQQAERREFGEIPVERFTGMEPIGGKLALQPDAQVSSLERNGEVPCIGQYLNVVEEISKEPHCFQILERWPPLTQISQIPLCLAERKEQR